MKIQHVVLVVLWSVCVCDSSSMASVVANQTTDDPGNCSLSKCPRDKSCTRVYFSHDDSTCIFLNCGNDTSCDDVIAELGKRARKEGPSREDGPDLLQAPSPSPESPISPTATAPAASTSASAAPPSPPVLRPGSARNSSGSSFNTSRTSLDGDLRQVPNATQQTAHQEQSLKTSLQNGHQGKPSDLNPSTPAPALPAVPVAPVGAENISSSVPRDHNGTQINTTVGETTSATTAASTATSTATTTTTAAATTTTTAAATTTTTAATTATRTSAVKPALPTNSTTATTSTSTTTVAQTTPSTTTNAVTSTASTTQEQPTSTPPPAPSPSLAPPVLPSVPPSSPSPGQNLPSVTPRVPDVTSGQGKAIMETAGGDLSSYLVTSRSLIAVLVFGLLFFVVTVVLFLRHAYESYKRRGYTQMDYLINGMYSDSGL